MFTLSDSLAHCSHPPDCIDASVFYRTTQFHLKQNLHAINSLLQGLVPTHRRRKVVLSPFAFNNPPCHCSSFYVHKNSPIFSSFPHSTQLTSSGFWYETQILYKTATQPCSTTAKLFQISELLSEVKNCGEESQ